MDRRRVRLSQPTVSSFAVAACFSSCTDGFRAFVVFVVVAACSFGFLACLVVVACLVIVAICLIVVACLVAVAIVLVGGGTDFVLSSGLVEDCLLRDGTSRLPLLDEVLLLGAGGGGGGGGNSAAIAAGGRTATVCRRSE